jgi:hypothetical protein
MPWRVIQRRIGKAGPRARRLARQREWDEQLGEGNWEIGYVIDGAFVSQETALDSIYYKSYELHFAKHPEDLAELIALAKNLRNPHAEATTGVDLQVPAILEYLSRNNLTLQGKEIVDIGSWHGIASHPISIRLSPLSVQVIGDPKTTLEQFWQDEKCLAVWE